MTDTEKALDEIAALLESGGLGSSRPQGGSRYFRFASSPILSTVQVKWDAYRRITGFLATPSVNFALTKNAMTVNASGLADSGGANIAAPADISAGNIIWVGQTPTLPFFINLNVPVQPAETLYISKNQNAEVFLLLYFDYE